MREPAQQFLKHRGEIPLIDVRSPAEFERGHIQGAINIPIFSNEERAEIGTLYKQKGSGIAIRRGLEIVGPKMASFVNEADKLNTKEVAVYCWRGGMRSSSMSWLLSTAGYKPHTLEGGYKAYRTLATDQIENAPKYLVLGGFTGSAKTRILQKMAKLGSQIIDLEGIANHKGSAFGNLEEEAQPHTEHFANKVWSALQELDLDRPIWIEDESKTIGTVYLSEGLYNRIKVGPLVFIERPLEERAAFLAKDYGKIDAELLKHGFEKITKRLGGQFVKEAVELVENGELAKAAEIGLRYYDKTYTHGLNKRPEESVIHIEVAGWSDDQIAEHLSKNEGKWIK